MKLTKISKERNDWHFWQILVVCTGSDFLKSGPTLIQSLEINSPDSRLVVFISDGDRAARAKLAELGQKLLSVTLYEAHLDGTVCGSYIERYIHIASLLEMTKIPALVMRVDSFVHKDLSLLPAELQKCDCSVRLTLDRKRAAERVDLNSFWLASNYNAQSLLKEVTRYLRGLKAAAIKDRDERKAFYFALLRCSDFIRVSALPRKYCEQKDVVAAYIMSDLSAKASNHEVQQEIEKVRQRFEQPVTDIVLYPKQDLGTKASLKNNQFKLRVARLSRPGRIYWRFMSRFLAENAWRTGRNARIVALPQWEIQHRELENFDHTVETIYLPHLIRQQLDHPKARYYMQELLPSLFTVDRDGWGAASRAYACDDYKTHVPDARLDDLLNEIQGSRITKAPQSKTQTGALPSFDILVPLQVPGDDALIYHADIGLEQFVEILAQFAERAKVRVLFRKHPYDETDFYSRMKHRFASAYVLFDSQGHIHDILQAAPAVAVINSGVGFEAMIYDKPLLSFGRAVYDSAVSKVTPTNIDAVYSELLREDAAARTARYRRFISWYIFVVGIKVNEPGSNLTENRLGAPIFGANPVYQNLMLDERANTRGIKITKLKYKRYWSRLRASSAHVLRRWNRAVARNWRRFRKISTNPLDTQIKSLLLKYLDDGIFEGKRVALVGNASSLRRGSSGCEIDDHDIVIRMNLGYPLTVRPGADISTLPEEWILARFVDQKSTGRETLILLQPDVPDEIADGMTNIVATGRKTDIWSCSTSDRVRQVTYAPAFKCMKVVCHPSYGHLSWKLLLKNRILRLRVPVFEELSNRLALEPTSGLIWIEYLTKTKLKSLDLYGFDFFTSGHISRTTPNVLQAGGKWPHDPAGERDYVFQSILKNDTRVTLVNSDGTVKSVAA